MYVAIAWIVWNIATLKYTARVIEAFAQLGQLLPWYVSIIPVLLFDGFLADAGARMGGVATRELASWETGATQFLISSTSNLVTKSASSIEAIIILMVATYAVKKALPTLRTYDREGDPEIVELKHPYFSKLELRPKRASTSVRWQAEYNLHSKYSNGTITIAAEDNYLKAKTSEPTTEEIEFCKLYLSDLSLLFPIIHNAAKKGWEEILNEKLPINWQKECTISQFTVPVNGEFNNNWSVVLYVKKTDDFIFVSIEDGESKLQ